MRLQNVYPSTVLQSTLISLAAVWVVVGLFHPQSSSAQLTDSAQKFEVAAIRATKNCNTGSPRVSPPGRLSVQCDSLAFLIQRAYGQFAGGRSNPLWSVPKVEGGPSWIRTIFYNIEAKADGVASRELMYGPMLQRLLEDRFKVKTHRETREVPVYALKIAEGGAKLKKFREGSCVPFDSRGSNPLTQPQEFCQASSMRRFGANMQTVELQGGDLNTLSWLLGNSLDRPVIDRTGLTGKFDVHLEFAPDQLATESSREGDGQATPLARGQSIFSAVQEQLGLKLEASRGPVEILFVDYAEKPSDN